MRHGGARHGGGGARAWHGEPIDTEVIMPSDHESTPGAAPDVEGALVVKRLAVNPAAGTVSIRSDNPAYPGWPNADPAALDAIRASSMASGPEAARCRSLSACISVSFTDVPR